MSAFESAGWASLTGDPVRVVVRGNDAEAYLQRMVSADLAGIDPGEGRPSTLMTPKGRLLALFDVFIRQEPAEAEGVVPCFDLWVPAPAADLLIDGLERLIILEDLTVEKAETVLATVQGRDADEVVGRLFGAVPHERPCSVVGSGPWTIVRSPRCRFTGVDVWSNDPTRSPVEELSRAGVPQLDADSLESARVDAGIPRLGVDTNEATIPPEVGLDRALSYTKGCYVGQEVVSRMHHLGHPNKLLRRIDFGSESAVPSVGDDIWIPDEAKAVGTITSAAQSPVDGRVVALGVIRYKSAAVGSTVAVGASPEAPLHGVLTELAPAYTNAE